MDFALTDEQLALQAAARDFARHEFEPFAAQWDHQAEFPRAAIAKAAALGFCGLY